MVLIYLFVKLDFIMIILGIETSCDETAICIIETDESSKLPKIKILGNQLYSQIALHAQYGGVFPMMAKREHTKNLLPLLKKCLEEAKISKIKNQKSKIDEEKIKEILSREETLYEQFTELFNLEKPQIDAIAVTKGPGLEPALWVGVSFAKALSELWNIPIIPTNHMEGHIVVAPLEKTAEKEYLLKNIPPPSIALLISGGHTQLVLMKSDSDYEIVGNTKDDAIGEAFDKVARLLGLPYPGGPQISKLADIARKNAEQTQTNAEKNKSPYHLPRPMLHSGDLNFSFSGIKTAVLYLVRDILQRQSASDQHLSANVQEEIAREFEDAVVEVIIKKTRQAVEKYNATSIIIGGGVSANKKIREDFKKLSEELNIEFMVPEFSASTDNAFMIALAGYLNIKSGKNYTSDFRAEGNLTL